MALVPANEMGRLRDSVKRFADGFTPGQKAVTVGAAAIVILGAVIFMSFASKPTFVPLFTNLKASDAASITANLTSNKIPFQLTDNGATIEVPANDVATERLAVSEAGLLPQSTDSLSILDKEGITASSLTQQADYLQGLQGELEQTIDAISGVASSEVNIAMPTDQTFSLASNTPTGASVLVTMNGGSTLTTGEVSAIVSLVGSSVPDLPSNEVTVADSNGDLLAGPGVSQSSGGPDSPTDSFDSTIQGKVEQYLTPIVGAANADVQVNAILDFDQVTTQTNSIVPGANSQNSNFCTSTNTSNENFSGSGTPPASGSTGALPTTGSGTNTLTQTSNQQNCETDTQSKTTVQAPGTVTSESVAVLVNSKALPPGVSVTQLQQGVANAAGIDTSRGDQLAFTAVPFSTVSSAEAAKAAAAAEVASKAQSLTGMIRTGVIVFVILIVLLLMWLSARKARSEETGDLVPPEVLAALQKRAFGGDEPTIQLAPNALLEVKRTSEIADINRFIDQQPDEVAKMIRGWMGDSQEGGRGLMASLTGQQKAAVVLAQLDPARATKVLKSFSESEVVNLMSAVATLPTLPSEAVQNVITEFSTQATAFAHVGQGGVEVARALLRERLGPSRADEILDEYTQATRKQPLEFLNRIDPQQMVGFIGEEHNQTIAVVLAHLHPDHAAAVLSHMDDAQRTDVARRVATLGRISPEVIQHLETVLERKLATVLRIGNATSNEVGGLAGIVAILNNTDRSAEKKILAELEETDPQLAEDIRNEMFVFDDVVSLDDRTLQRVLRNVPPKELAVALKGVLDEVRAKFLRNMSERAAVDLKDEIELLGPTRLSAVDAAQLTVVRAVRELEAAGEIVLARGDDDFV